MLNGEEIRGEAMTLLLYICKKYKEVGVKNTKSKGGGHNKAEDEIFFNTSQRTNSRKEEAS